MVALGLSQLAGVVAVRLLLVSVASVHCRGRVGVRGIRRNIRDDGDVLRELSNVATVVSRARIRERRIDGDGVFRSHIEDAGIDRFRVRADHSSARAGGDDRHEQEGKRSLRQC
jgi:hypothetical protein